MVGGAPTGTRFAAVFIGITMVFFLSSVVIANPSNGSNINCSRKCISENCNALGIRYGKYCGVGWSGCPGEKPCDDLDACCQIHDDCVDKKGLTNVKCHEEFKRCIKKVRKAGKAGFSKDCPYEIAMPTMLQGMDMAILLGQLGNLKYDEL